jgi:hypothetical protein
MGKTAYLRWALIPLSVALTVVALHKTHPVHADQAPPPAQKTLKLGEAQPGTLYEISRALTPFSPPSKTPRASSTPSGCTLPTSTST